MEQAIIDFKKALNEAYQQMELYVHNEAGALQQLTMLMKQFAPRMNQTDMYEVIYDLYIEEQTAVLNQCLEQISGWQSSDEFDFKENEMQ